ncbi:hypothetical protein OAF13_00350 [Akkermansiaceae bacterium]|nr:hypothetical protein [Akkermansiaceae bacterium]
MKTLKLMSLVVMMSASLLYGADNEIYIDQSGATFNLDAEQLGSGNIIGGATAAAGSMTALDLDGGVQTIDINQIGSSNKFLGDITADNFVGFWEFDGSTNVFNVQIDPTNTYGADGSNVNVDVTGGTNTFTLDLATTSLASNADVDWVIDGSGNTFDFNINNADATNDVNVDGDDNTVNFTGQGFAGGYFKLTQVGNSRTFNINQLSTQDNDWLRITSNGSNGTVCVIQNDQGTGTSC